MAETPQIEQTIAIGFTMKDPEGTAPVRTVAGHAIRVGEAWASLGAALMDMADAMDTLVAGSDDADEVTP